MTRHLTGLLVALLIVGGCSSMDVKDFEDAQPRFVLEDYFAGQTAAWGIFEDRFGKVRRQFTVDITGTWDGKELTLDERFLFSDGEEDQRIWYIRKTGEHTYEGRADDIIGKAEGEAYGNALNWRYDMDLKVGDSTLRVHFNDWMFLQPGQVLINKASVTKFGFEIGRVTLMFVKGRSVEAASHETGDRLKALRVAM